MCNPPVREPWSSWTRCATRYWGPLTAPAARHYHPQTFSRNCQRVSSWARPWSSWSSMSLATTATDDLYPQTWRAWRRRSQRLQLYPWVQRRPSRPCAGWASSWAIFTFVTEQMCSWKSRSSTHTLRSSSRSSIYLSWEYSTVRTARRYDGAVHCILFYFGEAYLRL